MKLLLICIIYIAMLPYPSIIVVLRVNRVEAYLMFVYNATTDADKLSFISNCTFENADNTNFYYYYFFGEDHDRLSFTNCVFRGSYNGVELSFLWWAMYQLLLQDVRL